MRKAGSFQPLTLWVQGERLVLLLTVTGVIMVSMTRPSREECHSCVFHPPVALSSVLLVPCGASPQWVASPEAAFAGHCCSLSPLFQTHWTVNLLYHHCFLGKSVGPQTAA